MTEENRADIIRDRLQRAFNPTHLDVINESDQHLGHAGHQGGNRHFAIVIAAPCFEGVQRLEAHRQIYALFTDMIPDKIHAFKIKIVQR